MMLSDLVRRIEFAMSAGVCAICQKRPVWRQGALRCRPCMEREQVERERREGRTAPREVVG